MKYSFKNMYSFKTQSFSSTSHISSVQKPHVVTILDGAVAYHTHPGQASNLQPMCPDQESNL